MLNGFAFEEVFIGGFISLIITLIFANLFSIRRGRINVKGFFVFFSYIPYYLFQETKCVLDVSSRIITGKIKPVIVEVQHSHESPWGITILANSITMTPGTLTLEAEGRNLYVHWLNESGDKNQIVKTFDKFLTKIWG